MSSSKQLVEEIGGKFQAICDANKNLKISEILKKLSGGKTLLLGELAHNIRECYDNGCKLT